MKKLILLILVIIPVIAFSQKKQRDTAKVAMPIKEGSIVYESIVDGLDRSKSELFNTSLKWMANSFADSKEVIQVKDENNGNIVGTGTFDYIAPGFVGGQERMAFMTDITVKDNKARIRIYQLRYKMFGSSGYKRLSSNDSDYSSFDTKYKEYLAEKKWPLNNKKLFVLVDSKISSIIESYTKFIKSNPKSDNF
ncbi:DUF4468 domain-containing protein [Pedobacter punctiformis]|uniref:DUF4468 domain-containing protein n=1 Tax=Pedobacter punctiformis TaxID=3004097 RepID=A0ABT4LAH0_9SPHI|nr:DUF4468 domain-containing protein [Pedobacter sp. HCMS5-2]MCZ4244920.1 DUF4468 domain-containing protein [Pedobacter sp. HCMS5-2]